MSELNRPARVARARRWTFPSSAVLAAAVTVAALLSAGADARSAAAPSNTTPPAVAGTAVLNETLTAVPARGPGRRRSPFARLAALRPRAAAARRSTARPGKTHIVTAGDIGSTLRVLEAATTSRGRRARSRGQRPSSQGSRPRWHGRPVVSGASFEGSTLSTTTGTWSRTSLAFSLQWVRCGRTAACRGSNCPSIPGAAASSYTLLAADIGRRLHVQVTASSPAGSATAASDPSALVEQSTTAGPPRSVVEPSISGPGPRPHRVRERRRLAGRRDLVRLPVDPLSRRRRRLERLQLHRDLRCGRVDVHARRRRRRRAPRIRTPRRTAWAAGGHVQCDDRIDSSSTSASPAPTDTLPPAHLRPSPCAASGSRSSVGLRMRSGSARLLLPVSFACPGRRGAGISNLSSTTIHRRQPARRYKLTTDDVGQQ